MNISFKGTYAISGDTILHNPYTKTARFFEVTKHMRKNEGHTLLDGDSFDYYVNVKDEKEKAFEHLAQKHKVKCKKADAGVNCFPVVGNMAHTKAEMESLLEVLQEICSLKV